MTADQANTWGLILDMLGILIVFFWGPPQPIFKEGSFLLLSGAVYTDEDRKTRRKRKIYTIMSRIGLFLIFVGFGLQLLAIYL